MKFLLIIVPSLAIICSCLTMGLHLSHLEHLLLVLWTMLIGMVLYSRINGNNAVLQECANIHCSCSPVAMLGKIILMIAWFALLCWVSTYYIAPAVHKFLWGV